MIGGFPPQSGTRTERQLLKLFKSLSSDNKSTLLKFAEFLNQQAESEQATTSGESQATEPAIPRPIERPASESVIKAIKRLKKTYYMLDSNLLLDKTSDLMTQHILNGREAASVIDDLEELFKQLYEKSFGTDK